VGGRSSGKGRPRHRRVEFRQNRLRPARQKRWAVPDENDEKTEDTLTHESVRAKGDLSRKRTVVEIGEGGSPGEDQLLRGIAIAVRGQFVDVDVDGRVWQCTIRRVLRTRLIGERGPVVVGDRVAISTGSDEAGVQREGAIEHVFPRSSTLTRSDGKRTHMIAANVEQVLVITSIREPMIKPHLIDRYLVAAHAGSLPAAVCVNKVDLDPDPEDETAEILARYERLGYPAIGTSTVSGVGLDSLRSLLAGRATLLAGQSGVGKSSLINAVEPGLKLKTAEVSLSTEKGRHTTTTAVWLKLSGGGAVVDTPGIRALDVAMVPISELEMHFVEFVDRLAQCKFPNCVHIHEEGCAIKAAVQSGKIDQSRYASYVELFYDLSDTKRSAYE
jgi:ribosome biogenesis GTPase / thiamine phosphate phosphatase